MCWWFVSCVLIKPKANHCKYLCQDSAKRQGVGMGAFPKCIGGVIGVTQKSAKKLLMLICPRMF